MLNPANKRNNPALALNAGKILAAQTANRIHKVIQQILKNNNMKKMIYLILVAAVLIIGAYFCLNCGDASCGDKCQDKSHNHNKIANTENSESCGGCGNNSCDKSCNSNPGNDSTDLKSLMPSCNLTNDEMIERKKTLQETMVKKINRTEELENGYDLIFVEPIEYSTELLEFINFERACCSNFSFALIFEPNNKATHLQMYGSKEIKVELKDGFTALGVLK